MRRGLLLGGLALIACAPSASAQFSMPTTEAHAGFFYPTAYKDQGGRDWACGSIYYSGHGGTDIGVGGFPGMDAGRDLVAAADGTVVTAVDGFFDRCTTANCPGGGGFGNYVSIDHGGGIMTYYGHMRQNSVAVSPGQQVTCGTYLGQVGSSGRSTGPHLHFDYRINNVRSDPFSGSCSGVPTAWNAQGAHGGIPGITCSGAGANPPFIVDDQDPGFAFTEGSTASVNQSGSGGHDNQYYQQAPFGVGVDFVMGRWTPDVPTTALYTVEVYVPSGLGSAVAPYDIGFQGGHAPTTVDLTGASGWTEIHPNQPFKFVQGVRNYVAATNMTFGQPSETVAWDAIRWTFAGTPSNGQVGQGCNWSGDCSGELVCLDGSCAQPCYVSGCDDPALTCEAGTGVCGFGDYGDEDFEPGPWWNPSPSDDTDGDGVPDWLEGDVDSDGDGLPNWLDLDSDGDGVPDSVEGEGDVDHDGVPNFLDEDSDNDGVPDSEEAGDDPPDSDGDGDPDFLDTDSDNDGLSDADEYGDDPDADADGDGIPNALDPDSDNDGISDGDEYGGDPGNPLDSDGDGIPDWIDPDSDNDGLPDSFEGNDDSDGDGIPDYLDTDSDNDGIPDSEDPDSDGDGIDDGYGLISDRPDDGPQFIQDCGCGGGTPTTLSLLPLLLLPFGVRRRWR
jgi:murein DD-endopeptidase MepM/ murein hydrolase activator NlpD